MAWWQFKLLLRVATAGTVPPEESGFVLAVTSLNENGGTERLVERFDSRQGLERFL